MLRMLEYFYAKFVYHHALFYKRDCDMVKSIKEYVREEHPIVAARKELGSITFKSGLPLSKIKEVEKIFKDVVAKDRAARKKKDGGYPEAKAMFEKEGIKVVKPKGLSKEGDRDTICTVHDGVRYHMCLMKGERKQAAAQQEVKDHNLVLERYHPLVKEIYEKIKQFPGIGDVWAMEGGGSQLQVFFGSTTGYLAILYLDMKSKRGTLVKPYNYTLQVNAYKNDILFKDFKVEGVEVRTSESVYGKK